MWHKRTDMYDCEGWRIGRILFPRMTFSYDQHCSVVANVSYFIIQPQARYIVMFLTIKRRSSRGRERKKKDSWSVLSWTSEQDMRAKKCVRGRERITQRHKEHHHALFRWTRREMGDCQGLRREIESKRRQEKKKASACLCVRV